MLRATSREFQYPCELYLSPICSFKKTNGANGSWDHLGTNYPSSIIYKDTLRIYYSGMQDSLFNFTPNIGYVYLDSTFTSVYLNNNLNNQLIKVIDILGRESNQKRNIPLFYIYDDGTVEKKIIIE